MERNIRICINSTYSNIEIYLLLSKIAYKYLAKIVNIKFTILTENHSKSVLYTIYIYIVYSILYTIVIYYSLDTIALLNILYSPEILTEKYIESSVMQFSALCIIHI